MMRTRVKVCCITSMEEARAAVAAGVDAIGLVGHMPSSPGIIEDNLVQKIASDTPPPISTFLLTSRETGHDGESTGRTVPLKNRFTWSHML